MKLALNVAAESTDPCSARNTLRSRLRCTPRPTGWAFFALLGAAMLWTGAAFGLDGIDLSGRGAEEAIEQGGASNECPRLIQIKYPFLRCKNGQIGSSNGNDTWDNSRHLPIQAEFVEGDGYFGPDLNED